MQILVVVANIQWRTLKAEAWDRKKNSEAFFCTNIILFFLASKSVSSSLPGSQCSNKNITTEYLLHTLRTNKFVVNNSVFLTGTPATRDSRAHLPPQVEPRAGVTKSVPARLAREHAPHKRDRCRKGSMYPRVIPVFLTF